MPEKPLRGAGPSTDAPQAPADSGVRGSPDGGAADSGRVVGELDGGSESGGAREGRKVTQREQDSGPRVALVPAKLDGTIDSLASTAETRRVVDIGRTTLMGVPSPLAEREKPTSPGHDVHLPGDTERTVHAQRNEEARPTGATGVVPAVEMDNSSTRRIGNVGPSRHQGANRGRPDPKATSVDRTSVDRTIAGAAATFRAGQMADRDALVEGRRNREPTHAPPFDVDDEQGPNRFVTALVLGVSLAVGFGIVVQGFIRSRVRGAHSADAQETSRELPPIPAPDEREKLNVMPAPVRPDPVVPVPALDDPAPQPAATTAPDPTDDPAPDLAPANEPDPKTERRIVARAKAGAPTGRPPVAERAPHPNALPQRPIPAGTPSVPSAIATPSAPEPAPAAKATQPPPQNSAPRSDSPKPSYDPDLPMPPSPE